MKKDLLLPRGFKRIGWALLLPSLLLGLYLLFAQDRFGLPGMLNEHLTNNIALIGTAIGMLFVGFARERHEDELITSLRLKSLLASVYINYALLILLALCCYDFQFLTCMFLLLYTIPTVYYLFFRWEMYRLNKTAADEE